MRRLLFLLALAVSCWLGAAEKPVVYVVKFEPNDECKASAGELQMLFDRVLGNVVSCRKYEVVERESLAEVQKELKWVDGGLTAGKAPQSNSLKAAGYCIYGKVVQFRCSTRSIPYCGQMMTCLDGMVEVQIRIANIENGRILAAKTVKSKKAKTVSGTITPARDIEQALMAEASDDAAKLAVEKLNDIVFPVYVISANSRYVTANVAEEQVNIGDVWEVLVLGDELRDPQTGEFLGYDEEQIACLRVSRPGAKVSKFAYGANDEGAEKAKKDILEAKADGEKMVLRRLSTSAAPVSKPSLREML